jgi:hypothetical protein
MNAFTWLWDMMHEMDRMRSIAARWEDLESFRRFDAAYKELYAMRNVWYTSAHS